MECLSGTWRVAAAVGDLHQRFTDVGFDDSGWAEAAVPGHWRSLPGFSETDGPVLYRRHFTTAPPGEAERAFLVFDGLFYYGDIWLDDAYLGPTEGYFAPHSFEVTAQAVRGGDHVLAVEVACPPERGTQAKRVLAGAFADGEGLDPEWNPGGLWRPVRLVRTGPVRISRLRGLCTEATEDRGRLRLHLSLDAGADPVPVGVVARLTGHGTDEVTASEHTLAAGENHLVVDLELRRPARWWPWRYGPQPLYDLTVNVEVDGGSVSDAHRLRTAFREVRLDNWRLHVNGERTFVMGANQGPALMALGEATPDLLAGDVARAVDANLDLIHLQGHVSRDEFYAAADEAGLLIWQDMPLRCGYARGARRPATTQARALVDRLGHHPSVALWCGHDQPAGGSPPWRGAFPSWNADVLDRSVARALRRGDPTRPVVPHSGLRPGPFRGGTDSHLSYGWRDGGIGDLAGALARWPRLARFLGSFGAASVPDTCGFMGPTRWPDLDWERLGRRHTLEKGPFDRLVPPADFVTFDEWRAATQAYQAALVVVQVEDLRRLRHRPTGGFCAAAFADGHAAVSAAVFDVDRRPKAALEALTRACRTTLPMLDPRTGQVHVANEARRAYPGARVEVDCGGARFVFSGDVPADGLAYVATVTLPEGAALATVTLTHPDLDGPVVNRYAPALLDALAASWGRASRQRAGAPPAAAFNLGRTEIT